MRTVEELKRKIEECRASYGVKKMKLTGEQRKQIIINGLNHVKKYIIWELQEAKEEYIESLLCNAHNLDAAAKIIEGHEFLDIEITKEEF